MTRHLSPRWQPLLYFYFVCLLVGLFIYLFIAAFTLEGQSEMCEGNRYLQGDDKIRCSRVLPRKLMTIILVPFLLLIGCANYSILRVLFLCFLKINFLRSMES